ncbi:hypothetical protein [Mycobacteroides abscessus]|uniref:hypothetical protein n=1 Tax=Mycobacteroides abscessus TaxID=36809 RepID=UPI0021081842|nr:hypothetical protein [Mycobacteroides abscessus]
MSSEKKSKKKDPFSQLADTAFFGLEDLDRVVLAAIRKAGNSHQSLEAFERCQEIILEYHVEYKKLDRKLRDVLQRNGYPPH